MCTKCTCIYFWATRRRHFAWLLFMATFFLHSAAAAAASAAAASASAADFIVVALYAVSRQASSGATYA